MDARRVSCTFPVGVRTVFTTVLGFLLNESFEVEHMGSDDVDDDAEPAALRCRFTLMLWLRSLRLVVDEAGVKQ